MRILFSLLVFSLLCIGCKTPSLVGQHTFTTELERILPYTEVIPKKHKPNNLALLIPDNPDTITLAHSELTLMLVKNGYRVIIPRKPGNNEMEVVELDNKSYRVRDINNLLLSIDTSGIEDFLIIGIGEGGYLVPDVSFSLAAKASIVINAGPASPLEEYQNLVLGKVVDQQFLKTLLTANLLFTKGELTQKIQRIEENPYGEPQLLGGSNAYWISYKQDPLMSRIITPTGNTLWVVSKNYPLISLSNKALVEEICSSLPYLTYKPIEGRGNFNREDEMKLLIEIIEEAINNQPQSY